MKKSRSPVFPFLQVSAEIQQGGTSRRWACWFHGPHENQFTLVGGWCPINRIRWEILKGCTERKPEEETDIHTVSSEVSAIYTF